MVSEAIKHLAFVRNEIEEAKARQAEWQAVLEATPEWQALQAVKDCGKALSEEEQKARTAVEDEALAAFRDTGDRKAHEGVEVKMVTRILYYPVAATAWCRENAPTFLTLDVKPFEKAAKAGLPGAPVEVIEEPKVYIARDLSGAVSD